MKTGQLVHTMSRKEITGGIRIQDTGSKIIIIKQPPEGDLENETYHPANEGNETGPDVVQIPRLCLTVGLSPIHGGTIFIGGLGTWREDSRYERESYHQS